MKNQFYQIKNLSIMQNYYLKEKAISAIVLSILSYVIGLMLLTFVFSFQEKEKKQCKGITTKKVQCKRMLLKDNKSDYCYQHSKETDIKNTNKK